MIFIDWLSIVRVAVETLLVGFANFIPNLIGALLVFVLGLFIAIGIGERIVVGVLKAIKFNQLFERGSWKEALKKADIQVDPSRFVGGIVKWVLIIVFLSASLEILGLSQFSQLLNERVLTFLPNIVVAVFIFVVAVILADILEKVLRVAVEGTRAGHGHVVGAIVRWSVWILAFVIILDQLRIAGALPQTLFTGLVAMLAIAGGLAFGLGGKDLAREILEDFKKKLKK